jgi:hypothetical protein
MPKYVEHVQVSGRLSCGCRFRKSKPMPATEANSVPGTVTICDRHDEFAVVTRVSTYLVGGQDALVRRFEDAGVLEGHFAEAVASEQSCV